MTLWQPGGIPMRWLNWPWSHSSLSFHLHNADPHSARITGPDHQRVSNTSWLLTRHVTTEHLCDQLRQRSTRQTLDNIPQNSIRRVIRSMSRHCTAWLSARCWHIAIYIYGTVNVDNGGISNMIILCKLTKHVQFIFLSVAPCSTLIKFSIATITKRWLEIRRICVSFMYCCQQ